MTDNTSNVGSLPLKFAFSFLLAITLIISPIIVSAQTLAEVENECSFAPTRANFQISTTLLNQNVAAGTALPVTINLTNNTEYDVSDVSLQLLFYRETTDSLQLVDRIWINEIFSISSEDSLEVAYEYIVPSALISGDYLLRVLPIFNSTHSFNDRVVLPSQNIQGTPFSVIGSSRGQVLFDTISVTSDKLPLNDNLIFVLPDVDVLPVNFSLRNDSNDLVQGEFNWHLYNGRVTTEVSKITSGRSELVNISSLSDIQKSVTIPLSRFGEYTLLLEFVDNNGLKSINYISLLIDGVADSRIHGVTVLDENGKMNVCVTNYGIPEENNTSDIKIELFDQEGEVKLQDMVSFRQSVNHQTLKITLPVPFQMASNLKLTTENSLIEQWYLCDSDIVTCAEEDEETTNLFLLVISIVIIVGGVIILFLVRRNV